MSERTGVITGLGAVAPNGVGAAAFGAALRDGVSGTRLLGWRDERVVSSVAASCGDWDPTTVMSAADVARVPRLVPMALAAAREAMAQAGLSFAEPGADGDREGARRVGLILGTGGGGIDFTLSQAEAWHGTGKPSLWTITNATHGNLAGELSIWLGLRGPSLVSSTGCASSSDAVGLALDQLRAGRAGSPDAWVVVGADAHLRPEVLKGMELLRVISTRDWGGDAEGAATASRPFCKTRDGFVLGEGAWAAVIERPGFARRREAGALGEVMGYGATCDAYHRVRPDPSMEETVRAMRLAVEDASLEMGDIEVMQYHGTATALNDAQETAAVKLAFGDHAASLAGTSAKSMIGHPQGASGMAGLVATVLGLRGVGEPEGRAYVAPTANLMEPDGACDLDYCAGGARVLGDPGGRVAMVNCLAFGAKNSALVIRV